ncbi:MAG: hypothetical protein ACRDTH_15015 [Pseudonocardiaceae bacterium]
MKQRFAPLALLFGLLTALMLGGTATAQAHGDPHSGFNCNNVGVGVVTVTCNTVIATVPVVVNIPVDRVLSDNELSLVEDSLNHVNINVLNIITSLEDIKVAVLNVTDSFNPDVTVGDIQLCLASICKS